MIDEEQALASADPAAHQQARTDAAADQETSVIAEVGQIAEAAAVDPVGHALSLTEQADRILALEQQAAELKAALDESLATISSLNEDKNALYAHRAEFVTQINGLQQQVNERDETIAGLTAGLTAARAEFAVAEGGQHASSAAGHTEGELHNLWCAAGGQLGQFEAVKRFVASL